MQRVLFVGDNRRVLAALHRQLRPLSPTAHFVLLSTRAKPAEDQLAQWDVMKYFAKPWNDEEIIDYIAQLGHNDREAQ